MGFRKLSDKYQFDATFYIVIFGLAALIVGVPYFLKKSYDRSRGAEVQELLTIENLTTMDACRKQAKSWVKNRTYGFKLTSQEEEAAEGIMARGLYDSVHTWIDDRTNSVSKEETDRKRKAVMSKTRDDLNAYLDSIGKRRK